MKVCSAYLVFSSLLLSGGFFGVAQAAAPASVTGRTIYHSDNTRTETITDLSIREMTETTYDANNLLGSKKVYMLNEKGEPMQGNVYDAKGNLVARCQTLYDEFGRRKEDRMINLNGEVFQQVIHEYGANGKEKPLKVVNISEKAPMIRPELLDLTKSMPSPSTATLPGQDGRFAPATLPAANAAQAVQPQQATPTEAPKKSFWKRLMNKDK